MSEAFLVDVSIYVMLNDQVMVNVSNGPSATRAGLRFHNNHC